MWPFREFAARGSEFGNHRADVLPVRALLSRKTAATPDGEPMEDLLMRAATVIAVALATFSSFPLTAQQQDTTPQQQAAPAQQTVPPAQQTTPTTAPDNQPAQSGAASQGSSSSTQASPAANGSSSSATGTMAAPIQLAPVKGELVGKLDSTSAKTGDSVVVKTRDDVKTADGTDIPKGSKLVGHVTGVQARGEGKENAQIAIKFDHAELKSGQSLPIESVIESVGSTESDSAQNSGGGSFGPPSGSSSLPGSGAGNSPSNGNMNGSNNNSAANAPRPNETPGGSTQSSTQSGTASANGNAPAPGSIVAKSGNVAIRMTSIPGILLANNISGQPFSNASGMLLGARRDIKLDGGTKVVLEVAMAPGGSASGPGAMNR